MSDIKIPEEVLELSKKLSKAIVIGEGGVANLDKDAYISTLPEDITADTVKKVQHHNANVVAAVTHAFGEKAIDYMKKQKDINSVQLVMPIEKDKYEVVVDRSREYPGVRGGEEKITKYGVVTSSYTVNGAVNSRGALKKVREHLNSYAEQALAPK